MVGRFDAASARNAEPGIVRTSRAPFGSSPERPAVVCGVSDEPVRRVDRERALRMAVAHHIGVVHGVSARDDRARHSEHECCCKQDFEQFLHGFCPEGKGLSARPSRCFSYATCG